MIYKLNDKIINENQIIPLMRQQIIIFVLLLHLYDFFINFTQFRAFISFDGYNNIFLIHFKYLIVEYCQEDIFINQTDSKNYYFCNNFKLFRALY